MPPIAAGAVAVAADHPPEGARRVPFVITPNPRRALALAAAKFYPRQPQTIAAVTGTSGKTSVAAFTRQIWERLGHVSASIGTIGLVSPKRTVYGSLTTPDPIALHRQLDEIARDGVTHLAFEASSHGLDQFGSTACASAPAALPTCRATTWIIILMSRITSPQNCGCSAISSRAGGAAVISADHDCSAEAIDAARSRHLRIIAVGRKADGTGEGIRLVEAFDRRLRTAAHARASRAQIHDQAAAGRRIPDRERAGRGRSRHRHRQRIRCRIRKPRTSRRRQGAARTRRRAQRRADLRRLRAQARRAGESAAGAAAICQTQARRDVRRRWRPRRRASAR